LALLPVKRRRSLSQAFVDDEMDDMKGRVAELEAELVETRRVEEAWRQLKVRSSGVFSTFRERFRELERSAAARSPKQDVAAPSSRRTGARLEVGVREP
jgi:hypothetical protein